MLPSYFLFAQHECPTVHVRISPTRAPDEPPAITGLCSARSVHFSEKFRPGRRTGRKTEGLYVPISFSLAVSSGIRTVNNQWRVVILRTMAQMSLEQSINCGFITPGLAQAALVRISLIDFVFPVFLTLHLFLSLQILVFFEVSCHPEQSVYRAASMLQTLDGLIRWLGFLEIDEGDPKLTRFSDHEVPTVITQPRANQTPYDTVYPHDHAGGALDSVRVVGGVGRPKVRGGTMGSSPQNVGEMESRGCSCADFKISSMNPQSAKLTPFWLSTPGWNSSWSLAETRYEEQRRLVWCALMLATAQVSFTNSLGQPPLDLAITKPWMFKVLLPGETLFWGNNPRSTTHDVLLGNSSPKDSVWALYARSQLLYASAVHVKHSDRLSEQAKSEFAVRAWLETERIETELNMHTCEIEKATSELSQLFSSPISRGLDGSLVLTLHLLLHHSSFV